MADLVLETCDRFVLFYDLVALVNDGVFGESEHASAADISPSIVSELLTFMLEQGFVKTSQSDSDFRITALGENFLREFQGMRRFP